MLKLVSVAAVVSLCVCGAASAQVFGLSGQRGEVNPDAAPRFGVHDVSQAGAPDPYIIGLEAGGPLNARRSGFPRGCFGIMTAEPSVEVRWDGGGGALNIFTAGGGDTTMGVLGPDGEFRCDDDGAGQGMNAGLSYRGAAAGAYKVWVGSFDNRNFNTRLVVSRAPAFSQPIGQPNARAVLAEPDVLALGPNFAPSPVRLDVMSGYGVFLGDAGVYGQQVAECPGNIGDVPSALIDWSGGGYLALRAESDADMVMLVVDPSGAVHCNDDSGDVDDRPMIGFDNALAGRYEVYVGTLFGFDRALPSALEVSSQPLQPDDNPW
jgi:hypothetical protein